MDLSTAEVSGIYSGSGIDQSSSYASEASPAEPQKGETRSMAYVCLGLLALSVSTLVVVLLVHSADVPDTTVPDESAPGGSDEDGGPKTGGPVIIQERPTSTDGTPTISLENAMKTTPVTGDPKLLTSLFCTVMMTKITSPPLLPEDGLCSYTFLDSIYMPNGHNLTLHYEGVVQEFIDVAKVSQRTEYGFGLHWNGTSQMERDLNDTTRATTILEGLRREGIFHYGYVDTPSLGFKSAAMEGMLRNLKRVDEILAGHPVLTVLTLAIYTNLWTDYTNYVLGDIFEPDVVVLLGYFPHIDHNWAQCRIVPTTYIESPNVSSYKALQSLGVSVSRLSQLNATTKATYALGLPLHGKLYTPKFPDQDNTKPGNYSFLNHCVATPSGEFYPIATACKDPALKATTYDSTLDADFSYDKKAKKFWTYDSTQALRNKLCKTKANATSTRYTIAVMRLSYEDGENDCGQGAYFRLHFLKRLLSFFRANFTSPAALSDCLNVR